jgi:hypothetical protein
MPYKFLANRYAAFRYTAREDVSKTASTGEWFGWETPCCPAEAQLTDPDKTWRQNLATKPDQSLATEFGDGSW